MNTNVNQIKFTRLQENMAKSWKVDTAVDKVSGTVVGMSAALDRVQYGTLDK